MAVQTQDNAKLVTLANLALYNHTLINNLGLTQDNGAYAYGGTREDNPEATTVGGMLDELYDLVKAGSTALASSKVEGTTQDDVVFTKDGDTNDYYIHATIGDDVVNVKLNADDFVRDSFLKTVEIVKVGDDGKEIEKDAEGYDEAKSAFKFTWVLDVPEGSDDKPASETTIILVSDLLGDLAGDKAISVENGKVSLSIADNSALSQEDDALELKIAEDSALSQESGALELKIAEESPLSQTADGLNIAVEGAVTYAKGEDETWTTGKTDGIVSADELAKTVEDVVEYVDWKAAASKTECKATINGTESAESAAFTVSNETGKDGQTIYTYNIVTATDKDITDLLML